jgi:hypothetical protein
MSEVVPKLLTLHEAAEILGGHISVRSLRIEIARGRLKADKKGRSWFTTHGYLREYAELIQSPNSAPAVSAVGDRARPPVYHGITRQDLAELSARQALASISRPRPKK